jgi:putative component of membrane protein insertase Oxa1/YidC/SpoIIIJ protein YidD
MIKPALLIVILMILAGGSACAKPATSIADERPANTAITAAPIHFFRHYLSRADGNRCPMTPSCSSYALTAIERHGALLGWIMACDRLMRCGRDELTHSPSVITRHGVRCRDTVENNDFWWH